MLARAGLTLQDFDFYEIHEAFAAQALCTMKAWEDEDFCKTSWGWMAPLGSIDRTKLNVNGSSVATGHPFAATGTKNNCNIGKIIGTKREWPGSYLYMCCWRSGCNSHYRPRTLAKMPPTG